MQVYLGFLKWITTINENKRNIVIIVILCYLIYGFINKNDRDCFGDKLRITSERDYFQKAFENERKNFENEREKHDSDNKRHLLYVEKQAKKLEELRDRTEQLEIQKK